MNKKYICQFGLLVCAFIVYYYAALTPTHAANIEAFEIPLYIADLQISGSSLAEPFIKYLNTKKTNTS